MTTAPTTPRLADDAQRGSHSVQRLVREFVDARLADCMEVMAEYPDAHFDLAIVDPPYGINVGDNKSGMGRRKGDAKAKYKMGDWDSAPPPDEYFRELRRVSKNQIIWGANHYIERMAWNSPCWLIWDKLYSNDLSFAAVEMAWTSFRTTAKKFECTPLQAGRIHPTQKPVKLYDWLLANYAKPGQRILDTHMGSGSIGIACHYYRCPLVACEIDPDYFRAACDRIERETAQEDWYLPNVAGEATASNKRTKNMTDDLRAVASTSLVGLPSVERGCTGKANLGRDYEKQAERLSAKHGKRYGVYWCPHCKGTHLTTKLDIAAKYFEPLLYVCKPNAQDDPREARK